MTGHDRRKHGQKKGVLFGAFGFRFASDPMPQYDRDMYTETDMELSEAEQSYANIGFADRVGFGE
jgi:hypothetical protein